MYPFEVYKIYWGPLVATGKWLGSLAMIKIKNFVGNFA